MAQLVARLSGGQEAVSSSLATPTIIKATQSVAFLFTRKRDAERSSHMSDSEYYGVKRSNVPRYFIILNHIILNERKPI